MSFTGFRFGFAAVINHLALDLALTDYEVAPAAELFHAAELRVAQLR